MIDSQTLCKPLQQGDQVDIVASSFYIDNEKSLTEGLQVLLEWGLEPRKKNITWRRWGYLAGEDSIRYAELHSETASPLKIFVRGGWGAARLLELGQPWRKGWLLGFSDVSSLLLSRLSFGFDGNIHGPLLTTLSNEPEWSKERLRALLFGEPVKELRGESWAKGTAQGPLVVSNLTVASHLLGSRHIPNLKGAILVLEDVNEEPYRVDRMLTHWRLTGALQNLAGLAFGNFKYEHSKEEQFESFSLNEILIDRSMDLDIPVVGNLPVGHCNGNAAIPLGRQGLIDGNKGILKVLPS